MQAQYAAGFDIEAMLDPDARPWSTGPPGDIKLISRLIEYSAMAGREAATRELIRRDLQTLWMQKRPTVVFVTHSIEEAVQLSNRVCVISPRPGRIERILDIDLPWPRDLAVKNAPEFTAHIREIQEIFHGYGVI